jgi:hypothetical protein
MQPERVTERVRGLLDRRAAVPGALARGAEQARAREAARRVLEGDLD